MYARIADIRAEYGAKKRSELRSQLPTNVEILYVRNTSSSERADTQIQQHSILSRCKGTLVSDRPIFPLGKIFILGVSL